MDAYQKDGFVNLGKLFTDQEVLRVREAFSGIVRRSPQGVEVIREADLRSVRSIMGWENLAPVLASFVRDERILSPVRSLLGPNVTIHQSKYNPKAPHGDGDKWDPHRGFTFWHFLDGVARAEGMLSVFIALTEQTIENGAVQTWKGSHKVSLQELADETDFNRRELGNVKNDTSAYLSLQIKPEKIREYDDRFEKVYWTGPAGNVWLVHSCNLHSSSPNTSSAPRELVANVYRSIANHPAHPRSEAFLCSPSRIPL